MVVPTSAARPWMQDLIEKLDTALGIQADPDGKLTEWLTGFADGAGQMLLLMLAEDGPTAELLEGIVAGRRPQRHGHHPEPSRPAKDQATSVTDDGKPRPAGMPKQATEVVLLPDGDIAYKMPCWWRRIGRDGDDCGNLIALPEGAVRMVPVYFGGRTL